MSPSEHYLSTPHLPQGRVGCVLIGESYREKLEEPLDILNIQPIWLPDNPKVDPRLRGHADLSVIHMGENRFIAQGNNIVNILTNRGFSIRSALSAQSAVYPADCGLNGCIVGNYFIHNTAYSDSAVLQSLGNRKIIRVGQGYAKCSVCVVDRDSMITSDPGIAAAAAAHGIDVLKISQGHIELAGFAYGFIGGSTFKLSAHELAFTGNLEHHPDKAAILDYLSKKGITPIFLTDEPIFDVGSVFPLTEA